MTAPRVDLRRLVGAGLVLAVVLSVPIIARRDGQRVAGTPVTARTVLVPAVGDCVAALTGPADPASGIDGGIRGPEDGVAGPGLGGAASGGFGAGGSGSGAAGPAGPGVIVIDGSAVVFGRCAGTHTGEVAAFRRDPPGLDPGGRAAAALAWCGEVAGSYREHLRWQVSAAAGAWAPVEVQRFLAVVGESEPAGWAVCAVVAPGFEPYRGSYLDSMADRAAPAPFGFCRSTDAPDQRVSCGDPHDEQVFATAPAGSTPTPDSCRDLVERLTAMRDPTGDGRLAVGVDGSGDGACRVRVVGAQRLTATLLGRGDAPLPLAPG